MYRLSNANIFTQNLILQVLILLSILLIGCAIAPQPTVDIYLQPIEGQKETKIDPETGTVSMVQNGVAVSLEPLDEVEIFNLTEDPRINPYLFVDRRGNVEPIYTVFELTVHNINKSRVIVEESALLIDRNGAQYANLPFEYFENLYENMSETGNKVIPTRTYPYYQHPYHRYYPYYQTYIDYAALKEGQSVAAESLFDSGKLFKGAKRRGLIIFDRLNLETTDVRIIVSEINVENEDGKLEKLKFNFDFRQVIAE